MSEYDLLNNAGRYKAHLDDIGVMTLPDQPGKRGYSAEEVKLHFKAPIDYLFALMKKGFTETQGYFDGYQVTFDWINKELERLSEGVEGKGAFFVPALQASPPDPEKVKVWLDTRVDSTPEEIPKEESVSAEEPVSFDIEETPYGQETIDFDPETSTLSFGDGTEIIQEGEPIQFDAESDENESFDVPEDGDEALEFGDGEAEDLTFGDE